MARKETQNSEMRAATRKAVLASAMQLFAENGYPHTTTREIARKAGISTGLMYHYFSGKESLLRAVFDHSMEMLSASFADSYQKSPPGEQFANLLRTIFRLLAGDEPFWGLFYALRAQPEVMRILGDDFRLWTTRLRELFKAELTASGCSDPELEAFLLYSLVEGVIQQYLLEPDVYPLERITTRLIDRFTGEATENETNKIL